MRWGGGVTKVLKTGLVGGREGGLYLEQNGGLVRVIFEVGGGADQKPKNGIRGGGKRGVVYLDKCEGKEKGLYIWKKCSYGPV